MKKLGPVLLLSAMAIFASAQDLVSYTSNGQLNVAAIQERYPKVFKDTEPPEITPEDVFLYKVAYRSIVSPTKKVTVSGLVAIPKSGAPKGLVIYYHGTTADRDNVPSRYKGDANPEEADMAILAFTTAGYAVAAPDYLGLGDHIGVHPYPLGSINCWSGIDLIKPAREIAGKANLTIGPNLFVTGYSEGGAAAMWATRKLQDSKDPLHQVTRSAPLSGPYDLSGAQAKSILSAQSNMVWLGARVYFSSYVALGVAKNFPGINLEDYFSPSFATYIPFVYGQRLPDKKTIQKLVTKAIQMGTIKDLTRIMKLEFRNALKDRDVTNPLIKRLIENDCFDWTPKVPMYLFCLDDDFLVTKENTLNAITAFRANGVPDTLVKHYVVLGRKWDHMKGALPGVIQARKFFDGGFEAVPTTTN